MKKAIILLSLSLAALATFAQKNDSIPKPQLTDTSHFISVQDVQTAVEGIKDKVTGRQLENFNLIWSYIVQTLSVEWQQKNTPKKK